LTLLAMTRWWCASDDSRYNYGTDKGFP